MNIEQLYEALKNYEKKGYILDTNNIRIEPIGQSHEIRISLILKDKRLNKETDNKILLQEGDY